MPWRAKIDKTTAAVTYVLQFLIKHLNALAFGTADPVFQVHDIIRNDDVGVFTRTAAGCAHAPDL